MPVKSGRCFHLPDRLFSKVLGRQVFDFYIKTDGVGCSIGICSWVAPILELQGKNEEERKEYWRQVYAEREAKEMERLATLASESDTSWTGIDPGRKKPFTARNGKSSKAFSNKRYYHESRFTIANSKATQFIQDVGLEEWNTGMPTLKGDAAGDEAHLRHLRYLYGGIQLQKLLAVKSTKKYRKLRWTRYIHNKKTITRFCKEVLSLSGVSPDKTIICFGDAKFAHNSRGNASSPKQTRFVKELRDKRVDGERVQLKPDMLRMSHFSASHSLPFETRQEQLCC